MSNTLRMFSIGLFQGLVLIAMAPLTVGILRWVKARLQGRRAPWVFQPYFDLAKLLAKPAVRPQSASFISALAPYVLIVSYGLLVFMVPVAAPHSLLRGDLILLVYVLGLARFTMSLAGLDTGAALAGLGSSREMFLYFLTEIGLALVIVALALLWRTTDIAFVLNKHWGLGVRGFLSEPELIPLGLSLLLLVLFEAERLPVDNPATHLELTMSQRAITLGFAGRDLALIEWAEAIKLMVLVTLTSHLFVPLPFPQVLSPIGDNLISFVTAWLGYFMRAGILLLILAVWESTQPKVRLRNTPRLALTAITLSTIAILYAMVLAPTGSALP